jgi:hypothetical protein
MARGINKVLLIEDIESSIEYAKSHRKFSAARESLLKGISLLADLTKAVSSTTPYDARNLKVLYFKILKAFKLIAKKQFILPQTNNQNSATVLLLRNKLKPTSDGKDASIDNKAANKIQRFFINLWNQEHVQSQNRAFA